MGCDCCGEDWHARATSPKSAKMRRSPPTSIYLPSVLYILGRSGVTFGHTGALTPPALGLLVLVLPKVSVCSQRTIILCLPTPIQAADEALALPMAAAAALAA